MTELIIWKEGSTNDFKLEINEKSIAKNFQVNTVGELKDRQPNVTKRFKAPKTPNNQKALEMLGVVGSTTDIPHGLIKAKLIDSGFEIVQDGRLDVLEETSEYYELSIIDGNNTFFDKIRNKTFEDLDWSALNHDNDINEWINSQTNTSGFIYAIGDFGNLTDPELNISYQVASVYVHTIWEMIFQEAGFTFNGSFFSDPNYLLDVINPGNGNSYDLIVNTNIDFGELFKNVKQYDFIKDVMQRYGLMFQTTKKELRFEKFDDVIDGKFGRVDWSDKFDRKISEKYISGYGETNTAKYKYESGVISFADGFLTANNIKENKDLFTSIYTASISRQSYIPTTTLLYQVHVYNDSNQAKTVGIRIFRIEKFTQASAIDLIDINNNTGNHSGTTSTLSFTSLDYQTLLDLHYDSFKNKVLNNFKLFNNSIKVKQIDIQNLDFFKLIHISYLGSDFYLNKISNYQSSKVTNVELIKINP